MEDRFIGSLIGLAVGDALGTTVEFRHPGSFEPLTDIIGGGPFQLQPGEWTDDTSMALCLAESLIEKKVFNASDQVDKYIRWRDNGYLSSNGRCFDIGNTVDRALKQYEATGNPFSGGKDTYSAGNGSLMRLTPMAMFTAHDPVRGPELCGESSKTTHATRVCVDACRYFGGLLIGALVGVDKEILLSSLYRPINLKWDRLELHEKIEEIATGSFKKDLTHNGAIRGNGYVVNSLQAALWAFYHTANFKDGALLAVNLGEDADTTGAIYGQLAGAAYGIKGIPEAWRGRLAKGEVIQEYAEKLYSLTRHK